MLWVVHVDMDAYFASVEQVRNPGLRGKPVIVGGVPGTRSTVATASYEARAFGVRSGMAIGEAFRLCPQGVFLPGTASLYVHTSARIFDLLREFSPRVEPASIDEAYIEVETAEPCVLGRRIQAAIADRVGLTASLGVSDSKYLSKVASSFEKPNGLTFLPRVEVAAKLWPHPVEVLHGVGAKTAIRLAALGCATVGDLVQTPVAALEAALGASGLALQRRARGEDRGRVTPPDEAPDAKSIGHEHTLEHDAYDLLQLEALLAYLVAKVGRRARKHGLGGRRVTLKLRDRDFRTTTRGRVLPQVVDTDGDILRVGRAILLETKIWERGVRLLGVSLELLVRTDGARQLALDFDAQSRRAQPVVDRLKNKYGPRIIGTAMAFEAGRASGVDRPRISFTPPRDGG